MRKEELWLKKKTLYTSKGFRVLSSLTLPRYHSEDRVYGTLVERTLRDKFRTKLILPTDDDLYRSYNVLVRRQRLRFTKAFEKTPSEIEILQRLKSKTKKQIESSMVIGPFVGDIFIPSLGSTHRLESKLTVSRKGESFSGLLIEVDGPIHEHSHVKLNKDSYKVEALSNLGIAVTVIQNKDIHRAFTETLLEQISALPTQCSKARRLLKKRIWVYTIAALADDRMLNDLFGLSSDKVNRVTKYLDQKTQLERQLNQM
jgi:hypothetical protein